VRAEAADSCVECHSAFETGASAPTQAMHHDVHIQRGLSCADCHGGDPAAADQAAAMDPAKGFIGRPARNQIPQFCASCHGSHEAARPGVVAVGNVCAQCHGLTRDLFAKSPHKAAHEALGLPECEVCHGNHLIQKPSDAMLGTGTEAVCVNCHAPDSAGYRTAGQMREAIERLKADLGSAEQLVAQAEVLGMDTADAEFGLHEAGAKLTQARTYVHTFSFTAMEPIVEEGGPARAPRRGAGRARHP
jgi:predicted CXXCH cytochrome family protein